MTTPEELADWLQCSPSLLFNAPKRMDHASAREIMAKIEFGYVQTRACIGVEKGGVGKTFLSINVAAALASRGAKVLLLDMDPQSCATNYLLPNSIENSTFATLFDLYHGREASLLPTRISGVDVLPAKPELRLFEQIADHKRLRDFFTGTLERLCYHDAIIFDVPPFFGNLSSICYSMCHKIIMPVTPDAWSLESVSLTTGDVEEVCSECACTVPDFSVLPNRVNPTRRSTNEMMARLSEDHADMLLPFSVQESAGGLNAINDGLTVFSLASAKRLREPINALARYICPPIPIS